MVTVRQAGLLRSTWEEDKRLNVLVCQTYHTACGG